MGPSLSDHSDHSQPTTRPERTAEPPTGSLGKHGRGEDGLRFGGFGDAGITQLTPKCQSSVGGEGSKLKENIGPGPRENVKRLGTPSKGGPIIRLVSWGTDHHNRSPL